MSRLLQWTCFFVVTMACGLWMSAPAEAIVIDSFDIPQDLTDLVAGNPGVAGSVNDPNAPPNSIFGSNRGLYVEKTSPPPVDDGGVRGLAQNGNFSVNRDSGTGGRVLIQWDGDGVAPSAFDPLSNLSLALPPVDLETGHLGILIKIVDVEALGQKLKLTLFSDVDGNSVPEASSLEYTVAAFAPPSYDAPFYWGDFTGTADKTQIRAIALEFTGPAGHDIKIDLVGTIAPEPTSATMLGLGAVGLFSRWRRRRRLGAKQHMAT